jgi:hypothetical protein
MISSSFAYIFFHLTLKICHSKRLLWWLHTLQLHLKTEFNSKLENVNKRSLKTCITLPVSFNFLEKIVIQHAGK